MYNIITMNLKKKTSLVIAAVEYRKVNSRFLSFILYNRLYSTIPLMILSMIW